MRLGKEWGQDLCRKVSVSPTKQGSGTYCMMSAPVYGVFLLTSSLDCFIKVFSGRYSSQSLSLYSEVVATSGIAEKSLHVFCSSKKRSFARISLL